MPVIPESLESKQKLQKTPETAQNKNKKEHKMKKFKNIFLAFAAISALSLAFVSCSDDSDDDDSSSSETPTDTPTDPTQDPTTDTKAGTYEIDITKIELTDTIKGYTNLVSDSTKNAKFVLPDESTPLDSNGFFTAKQGGTIAYYTNSAHTKISALEIGKFSEDEGGSSYIAFTVTGTLTVTACSTGSSNKSDVTIIDSTGTKTEKTVTGTTATAVTFENLAAGEYKLATATTNDRTCRVTSLSLTQE